MSSLVAKPLCRDVFVVTIFAVKPLASYTCKLTDEQASALDAALRARDWKPREVPYARFAYESPKANIVFYESGKLVVQGKGRRSSLNWCPGTRSLEASEVGI